jgi:hypothetical protein
VPRRYKQVTRLELSQSSVISNQFCIGGSEEKGQLKGAAVPRGLGHGSRGIATVRSRYQETSGEDTAGWERLRVIG